MNSSLSGAPSDEFEEEKTNLSDQKILRNVLFLVS